MKLFLIWFSSYEINHYKKGNKYLDVKGGCF